MNQAIKTKGEITLEAIQKLKFPEDFINKIILGDALKLIKLIPDNSVDVVLTDPPYGLNKNGVKNDTLTIFYNILPECHRVLKDNSFFITFLAQNICPSCLKIILSNISGKLFFTVQKEGSNLL